MKFGINNQVNCMKKKKLELIMIQKKKIKLPSSRQRVAKNQKRLHPKIEDKKMEDSLSPIQNLNYSNESNEYYDSHELNKISLIILFGGLGYWLFG